MELPDVLLGHALGTTQLRDLATNPRCERDHTIDGVAGYIVRQTIERDGTLINPDQSRMGHDVAMVPAGQHCSYSLALAIARSLRTGKGWALVDSVWPCGHRS